MRLRSAVFFLLLASVVITLFSNSALAAAPEGIPRELARQRATAISNVRYNLSLWLQPNSPVVVGYEEITFTLSAPQVVLVDYRGGIMRGGRHSREPENGHIVIHPEELRAGDNKLTFSFESYVAPAGKPLIRYEDKDDNTQYIYTLFVPMDASMAFPCFDQPDLKARFTLSVAAPEDWTVVSNTEPANIKSRIRSEGVIPEPLGGHELRERIWQFAETKPISTYLFAFAAGHFKKIERPGMPSLYVRQSKFERAQQEAQEVQETAQRGIEHLSQFFAQPFPFPKYDMVLIPGFAYGGMEHAGATFLREESVLFRTAPTHSDRLNRDILLLHELTHQWFGDLVTMRWFDDLWLKEGFAQYMAYHALNSL